MASIDKVRATTTKKLYRGFSSFNYEAQRTTCVYDISCVKIDLLNHLYTKKGSRVMMPTFGTIIPELLFEQLTPEVVDQVAEEVDAVIAYDPRVELANDDALVVTPLYDQNTIVIAATLRYIELDMVDVVEFRLEFAT